MQGERKKQLKKRDLFLTSLETGLRSISYLNVSMYFIFGMSRWRFQTDFKLSTWFAVCRHYSNSEYGVLFGKILISIIRLSKDRLHITNILKF